MTTATGWTITEGGDFGALERLNEESERRLVNDLATLCDRYTCVALFSFSSRWFFVAGIGMWAYGPNWAGGQAFRRYERSRSDTVRARGRCLPLIRPFSAGAGALLSRASSMPSWVRGRPERSTTGICLSPCLSLSLSLSLSPLSLFLFLRSHERSRDSAIAWTSRGTRGWGSEPRANDPLYSSAHRRSVHRCSFRSSSRGIRVLLKRIRPHRLPRLGVRAPSAAINSARARSLRTCQWVFSIRSSKVCSSKW